MSSVVSLCDASLPEGKSLSEISYEKLNPVIQGHIEDLVEQLPYKSIARITYIDRENETAGITLDDYEVWSKFVDSVHRHFYATPPGYKSLRRPSARSELKDPRFNTFPKSYGTHRPISGVATIGYAYATFIEKLQCACRIVISNFIYHKNIYNAVVVDFGFETTVYPEDIYRLPPDFVVQGAMGLACKLPNEHLLSSVPLPGLDAFQVGQAIEVYILSAFEPCLTVFGQLGRITDAVSIATLQFGIYPDTPAFNAIGQLETGDTTEPIVDGLSYAPSFWIHGQREMLTTVVDNTDVERVAVRDVISSLRLAAINEALSDRSNFEDTTPHLQIAPGDLEIGLPVVVRNSRRTGFLRGTIFDISPDLQYADVDIIDYGHNSCIRDAKINFDVFLLPAGLSVIPPQVHNLCMIQRTSGRRLDAVRMSLQLGFALPVGSVVGVRGSPTSTNYTFRAPGIGDVGRAISAPLPRIYLDHASNHRSLASGRSSVHSSTITIPTPPAM